MRLTPFAVAALASAVVLTLSGCVIVVGADGGATPSNGWSNRTVVGDGQYRTDSRTVSAVEHLDVRGALQVEVRVGAAPSLSVEADGNLLPLVHTEVNAGTLQVWADGNFRSDKPIRVVLTTPQLTEVRATGSGRLTVGGLHGAPLRLQLDGSRKTVLAGAVGRLDIRMQGSGGLDASGLTSAGTSATVIGSGRLGLGQVVGDELQLEVQGSGGVRAGGVVRKLTVRQTGSGDVDLNQVRSQDAELHTQGSGDVDVAVAQTLVIDSTGSGSITVRGDPGQRTVRGRNVTFVQ